MKGKQRRRRDKKGKGVNVIKHVIGMHKTMNYFVQWFHGNEILKRQRGEKENKDAI